MINGSAVNPNVGIRKVVLISTKFRRQFQRVKLWNNQTPLKMKETIKGVFTQ